MDIRWYIGWRYNWDDNGRAGVCGGGESPSPNQRLSDFSYSNPIGHTKFTKLIAACPHGNPNILKYE